MSLSRKVRGDLTVEPSPSQGFRHPPTPIVPPDAGPATGFPLRTACTSKDDALRIDSAHIATSFDHWAVQIEAKFIARRIMMSYHVAAKYWAVRRTPERCIFWKPLRGTVTVAVLEDLFDHPSRTGAHFETERWIGH